MIPQSIRNTALALLALISSTSAQVQSDVQLNQNLGINPVVGAPTVANGNQTQLTIAIDRPNQTSATSATVKLTATVTLVGLVTSVK